jgi:hypothetical protein
MLLFLFAAAALSSSPASAQESAQAAREPSSLVETSASAGAFRPFAELYSEASDSPGAGSVYAQYRLGFGQAEHGFETYGALRTSVGSDNYLFAGPAVDYVGLLPGLRLRVQAGARLDPVNPGPASAEVLAGPSYYGEFPVAGLFNEVYSEAYWSRVEANIVPLALWRTGVTLTEGKVARGLAGKIQPIVVSKVSGDTAGLDANRYAEAHAGVRFSLIGGDHLSASLIPGYALGTYLRGGPDAAYGQLRAFGSLYLSF